MQSQARDVAAYLAEVPAERRPVLEALRNICRKMFPDCQEQIEYGMPCYKRAGALEVAFASQKQYVALYLGKKEVVDEFRDKLPGASVGKGCIRFKKPGQIDFAVIEQLMRRSKESTATPC